MSIGDLLGAHQGKVWCDEDQQEILKTQAWPTTHTACWLAAAHCDIPLCVHSKGAYIWVGSRTRYVGWGHITKSLKREEVGSEASIKVWWHNKCPNLLCACMYEWSMSILYMSILSQTQDTLIFSKSMGPGCQIVSKHKYNIPIFVKLF